VHTRSLTLVNTIIIAPNIVPDDAIRFIAAARALIFRCMRQQLYVRIPTNDEYRVIFMRSVHLLDALVPIPSTNNDVVIIIITLIIMMLIITMLLLRRHFAADTNRKKKYLFSVP